MKSLLLILLLLQLSCTNVVDKECITCPTCTTNDTVDDTSDTSTTTKVVEKEYIKPSWEKANTYYGPHWTKFAYDRLEYVNESYPQGKDYLDQIPDKIELFDSGFSKNETSNSLGED